MRPRLAQARSAMAMHVDTRSWPTQMHFLFSVSDERAPIAIRWIINISFSAPTVVSFALRFGERPAVPQPRNQIRVGDERLTKGGEVDRARSDQLVCFRQRLAAGQDQRTLVERRPQVAQ